MYFCQCKYLNGRHVSAQEGKLAVLTRWLPYGYNCANIKISFFGCCLVLAVLYFQHYSGQTKQEILLFSQETAAFQLNQPTCSVKCPSRLDLLQVARAAVGSHCAIWQLLAGTVVSFPIDPAINNSFKNNGDSVPIPGFRVVHISHTGRFSFSDS